MAFDVEEVVVAMAVDRQAVAEAGREDARNRIEPLGQLAEELAGAGVRHFEPRDHHRDGVVRADAGIGREQVREAAAQQSGGDHQHERQGHFDGCQRAAEAAVGAALRGGTAAFPQALRQIAA